MHARAQEGVYIYGPSEQVIICPLSFPQRALLRPAGRPSAPHNLAHCLQIRVTPLTTKKIEHQGIRVQLIGQIELAAERGSPHDFVSLGESAHSLANWGLQAGFWAPRWCMQIMAHAPHTEGCAHSCRLGRLCMRSRCGPPHPSLVMPAHTWCKLASAMPSTCAAVGRACFRPCWMARSA